MAEIAIVFVMTCVLMVSLLAYFSLYFISNLNVICYLSCFVVCFVLLNKSTVYDIKRNLGLALSFASIWLIVLIWTSILTNTTFSGSFYILWGFFFLLIRDDLKIAIFNLFIKTISFFLLFSIIEYVVFMSTGQGIVLGSVVRVQAEYDQEFIHLLFNFIRIESIPRFLSLTNEPGTLGTLCGFLIFLLNYKKGQRLSFFIIWLSGLISLSFAFYVLAIINLAYNIVFMMKKNRNSILFFSVFLILLGLGMWYFEETISDVIVDRFTNQEVNERNDYKIEKLFFESIKDGSILWAHNADKGSGAIGWIYYHGLISFILVFLLYFSIFKQLMNRYNSYKVESFLFLTVFWLSFYQRQYIIYPTYVFALFICPLVFAKQKKYLQVPYKRNSRSIE